MENEIAPLQQSGEASNGYAPAIEAGFNRSPSFSFSKT
jgi:hypothetical protein